MAGTLRVMIHYIYTTTVHDEGNDGFHDCNDEKNTLTMVVVSVNIPTHMCGVSIWHAVMSYYGPRPPGIMSTFSVHRSTPTIYMIHD